MSGSSGSVEIESVSLGALNFGVLDSGVDFEVDLCFLSDFLDFFGFDLIKLCINLTLSRAANCYLFFFM